MIHFPGLTIPVSLQRKSQVLLEAYNKCTTTFLLKRLKPFIIINTTAFYYCDVVWSNLNESLTLQKLQNRAARVILSANYDARSHDLLESLK